MYEINLTGHVGADAKVETTKKGSKYVTFRLGNNEYGREETYWHTVNCWENSPFFNMAKNLKKGSSVILSGELRYDSYTDKNGIHQEGKTVNVHYMSFVSTGKKDEDATATTETQAQPVQPTTPSKPTAKSKAEPKAPDAVTVPDTNDDDLPF